MHIIIDGIVWIFSVFVMCHVVYYGSTTYVGMTLKQNGRPYIEA